MNRRFGVRKSDEAKIQALLETTGASDCTELFSLFVNRYGQHMMDTFVFLPIAIEQSPLTKPLPLPDPEINEEFTPFEL